MTRTQTAARKAMFTQDFSTTSTERLQDAFNAKVTMIQNPMISASAHAQLVTALTPIADELTARTGVDHRDLAVRS